MSVYKRRSKNTIWRIEFDSPKSAHAPIAAKLASFAKHKKLLLNNLRDMYEHGPKSEPFDHDKSWRSLTRIAELYFWLAIMKEETMPVADRVKRLRQLAKVLGQARNLVEKAIQDHVGIDLFRGWCAEANISPISVTLGADGSALTRTADEIQGMVASLGTLETAARTCASKAVGKNGRPLAGAALNSFLKKCKQEACLPKAVSAEGKKLSGAAKNSFMRKYARDA